MTGVWPPSGHLWRAPTSIRLQSRSRLFAKGHLWALGTASFARPPARPSAAGCLELVSPGPGQTDFGRIDISTAKDALGSMHCENTPRLCSRHRMIGVKPASGRLCASSGAGICGGPSCGNSIRVALYSETSQNGAETSSKKLPVSIFAATQAATHPSISSSDDQDMRGRVRCGLPNAC